MNLEKEVNILNLNDPEHDVLLNILNHFDSKFRDIKVETFFSAYKTGNNISGAIIAMALYMWEFEERFDFCVSVLSYILLCNGTKPSSDRKKHHFKLKTMNFNELEAKLVTEKCNFLADNGFPMFNRNEPQITKFREMRNNLAHFNLRIDNDGVIKRYNEKTRTYDMLPVIPVQGELMEFSTDILSTLWSLFFVS